MEKNHATLRTFRAPDARAALAAVKAALGPDAVIVSTREVQGGLFRTGEVEIVAALEAPAPPAEPLVYRRPRAAAAPSPVRSVLIDAGVEETIADDLVARAMDAGGVDEQLGAVRRRLARLAGVARAPWLERGRIALVGPTGVGKTTTLAKIAARAVLESRMRVALVTVDTYRVGASEQLARYGEMLGVPTYVARDRRELHEALERSAAADLVLVDTAGRATSEAVAQQAETMRTVPGLQLHLVASLATGTRELAAVAERYRPLAPERIVLTKLDEAVAPGCGLSLLLRLDRPVGCVANGQRVPEDLRAADAAELASLFTRGPEARRLVAGGGRA